MSTNECIDRTICKDLPEFHPHREMADGRHNYRIICFRRRNRERYCRRKEGDTADKRRTRPLEAQGHRVCPDRGQCKPASEHARGKKATDGLHTHRRPCDNARSTASDGRVHGGTGARHRMRRYGLSAVEVAVPLGRRGGLCAICGREPAAHVDHDHATGAVRGMLCFTRNVGLGNFKDDPELLAKAIEYLSTDYLKGDVWPTQLESPDDCPPCS